MTPTQFWKNFTLGEELQVCGTFIYNGTRRFHEMRQLDYEDEVFAVLYDLSVGIERLLKIAIVLIEHDDLHDRKKLEKSLKTHSHLALLGRIKKRVSVNLSAPHNEFLGLLGTFYKSLRYDRFSLASKYELKKEMNALCDLLSKYLQVQIQRDAPFQRIENNDRYRQFIRKTVSKISVSLYEIVKKRAGELNLYTYELRIGSKAETVFHRGIDIPSEDVLWKELLVFFMNTESPSGYLQYLRDIPPLRFDSALIEKYLGCFQSDAAKASVMDELEHLYDALEEKGKRLALVCEIADPNACFDPPEDGEGPMH